MLEPSVPFCPAHLHNLCQLQLCLEQINDDDDVYRVRLSPETADYSGMFVCH